MTEAVKLVTAFGFKAGLRRIYATVFLKNRASQRVLEKAGYKKEGILQKHYRKNKKFIDAAVYAKVR